jgi:uncharacterized protein
MPSFRFNFFRERRYKDKILLVTDNGSFDVLNYQEYRLLMAGKIPEELFKRLELKQIIVTDANEEAIIERYKTRKPQIYQGTSLHIIVTTLRCNGKCIYCHASAKTEKDKQYDMTIETARKTVDFIFQSPANAITIELQGGESLMNFDVVKDIIHYSEQKNEIAKKNLNFSIVTNLSFMTSEILDFLILHKIGICTSLDGPKKIHDQNRILVGGSSHDETTQWIKIINKEYHLNALMSTTKYSLSHSKEIVDEYRKLGLKTIWLRYLNNIGWAAEKWEEISYDADEYLKFWKEAVDYSWSSGDIQETSSKILLTKIIGNRDPMYLDLMSPCGAAIGQLAYNYDGKIYCCDEARMIDQDLFELGDIRYNTYKEIMTSDKVCNLVSCSVNDAFFCDTCLYKPYCGLCPVNIYASKSSLLPNLTTEMRCRILKGQFDHMFSKLLFEDGFRENAIKVLGNDNIY